MAAPVQRLQPTKLPTLPSSTTPEQRYWRTFASPLLIHEYSNITSIHFSPSARAHDFAVTSASLIKIFSAKTRAVSKTISRFKETAYAGQIRRDGKVMAAADATGTVLVFDLASRAVLRTWAGEHKAPVQALRWNPRELTGLVTASDDTTVRLWDLPARESVTTFTGHEDYVRSVAYLPVGGVAGGAGGLVVSGSYDTTARIWDPRIAGGKAAMTFRHDTAVEDVLAMPGGTTLLCATGNVVRVWDVVAAKEIAVLSNHQKTVTSLAHTTTGEKRRVLTGALDGHVKIYDTASWTVVHGVKYPAPILSLAVSPDEKHLAVGMVGGLLSIRTRRSGGEKDTVKEKERAMDLIMKGLDPRAVDKKKGKSGNKARKLKGLDYKGEEEELIIDAAPKRAKKERAFEVDLRKGRYTDALDRVLGPSGRGEPSMILTVVKELVYRNAVGKALANRDEEGLRPVIEWCVRCVGDPRMVGVVVEVVEAVLDLYSHALGQSIEFDKLVTRLTARINNEVENARQAQRTVGMLGMLVAGNE
ncbi:WD40-repeat-containing domain protein [Tricharina praecox]|uniref:WD40-repeat-containing domain protein n=1 Tax=Tricharina praecox TaxID=43433 RepID=UPI00221FAF79|nr:WD40-repeat-containing domain protein [Tricharina praecox]KAI5857883.1 WD40-repeat-containing domain protein [Tricharina praecox]